MSPTEKDPVEQNLGRWLKSHQSGCHFAASLAGRVSFAVRDNIEPTEPKIVSAHFELAAAEQRTAIVIYPSLRSEEDVVQLLLALATDDRWTVSRGRLRRPEEMQNAPTGEGSTTDVLVCLEWRTATAHQSRVMGLAPIGTMPVTRRAPYVALAAWTAGHANPFHVVTTKKVGFLDAAHDTARSAYDTLMESTERDVGRLFGTPQETAFTKNLTFRLHERVGPLLAALLHP